MQFQLFIFCKPPCLQGTTTTHRPHQLSPHRNLELNILLLSKQFKDKSNNLILKTSHSIDYRQTHLPPRQFKKHVKTKSSCWIYSKFFAFNLVLIKNERKRNLPAVSYPCPKGFSWFFFTWYGQLDHLWGLFCMPGLTILWIHVSM